MLNEQKAWAAVHDSVRAVEQLPSDVRSQIVSITVAGSLPRGDFVENRSDVDVYTIVAGEIQSPWESDAHARVRSCFDRHFAPYKGDSLNPHVWDDVCLGAADLPACGEDFARCRFKTLGIYFFDFQKHHKTVWGEDFTASMPQPVDPRPLVAGRLSWYVEQAQKITRGGQHQKLRIIPHLAGGAVTALQIYYGDELSIDKFVVLRQYTRSVPDFPGKSIGLEVWTDYLSGDVSPSDNLPNPPETYLCFLKAARKLLANTGP